MTSLDELKTTIRRNKFLGMWAAEKLGLVGGDAEAYADALAVGTIDPERSDVFSKIRKDFDSAGVVQSDEQILRVMNELILKAADQMQATGGGASDAAANARAQAHVAMRPVYRKIRFYSGRHRPPHASTCRYCRCRKQS
jgi:hypothetical protein